MNIGQRIKDIREGKGLTQSELAEGIGSTRSLVNMWEAGERVPKVDMIVALANFLNVDCDYLLRGVSADKLAIAEKTGLTDKAIEKLSFIKSTYPNDMKCINRMLEDFDDIFSIVSTAADAFEQYQSYLNHLVFYDNCEDAIQECDDEIDRIYYETGCELRDWLKEYLMSTYNRYLLNPDDVKEFISDCARIAEIKEKRHKKHAQKESSQR